MRSKIPWRWFSRHTVSRQLHRNKNSINFGKVAVAAAPWSIPFSARWTAQNNTSNERRVNTIATMDPSKCPRGEIEKCGEFLLQKIRSKSSVWRLCRQHCTTCHIWDSEQRTHDPGYCARCEITKVTRMKMMSMKINIKSVDRCAPGDREDRSFISCTPSMADSSSLVSVPMNLFS